MLSCIQDMYYAIINVPLSYRLTWNNDIRSYFAVDINKVIKVLRERPVHCRFFLFLYFSSVLTVYLRINVAQ